MFKVLDIICKQTQLRFGMKRILDRVCAENRSLTLTEELEYDGMAIQLRELDAERENRRIMDQMLTEHIHQLLKEKQ